MKQSYIYLVVVLILHFGIVHGQNQPEPSSDTSSVKKVNKKAIYSRARKATIMSAVMPGLGQLYNKKYWKAPIVYAAIGGIGYWGITNHVEYKYYSDNLRAENDNDPNTLNVTRYSSDQLISQKNYYKKYRDMSIIFGSVIYLINILDANVDAHLKTFDVSDDLSLQLKPYSGFDYQNKLQTGVTLKLKFK